MKQGRYYQNQAASLRSGPGALALAVLLQAKKDSKKMPNQLWATVQTEFIRPADGGVSDTAEQIAAFVSGYCINGRLKCPECGTLLRTLHIDIVNGLEVKRLFECPNCDGIFYHGVIDDVQPGVRI